MKKPVRSVIRRIAHWKKNSNNKTGVLNMFGSLGEMAGLMKKFGEIQSNMKKMQAELSALELTGTSHSGLVSVLMSGDMMVKKVTLSDAASGADKSTLEVAIQEAVASAMSQIKAEGAKRLQDATGGIKIPGLFGN